MATARQEVLIAVINYIHNHREEIPLNFGGVLDAEAAIYKELPRPAQRWLDGIGDVPHWKFSTEVFSYLYKGIILDYSDLEPGGRYDKRQREKAVRSSRKIK